MPKMSPAALERLRKLRQEQRIGQNTRRKNRIRARHRVLLRPKTHRENHREIPVASLKCGSCDRPVSAFHRESGMCRRCYDLDTRDIALTLSSIGIPPTSLDLLCAAYDHEED